MRSTHCEQNTNANKQTDNFDMFRLYPVMFVWQLSSDCVHGFIPFEREIVQKMEKRAREVGRSSKRMHVSKSILEFQVKYEIFKLLDIVCGSSRKQNYSPFL